MQNTQPQTPMGHLWNSIQSWLAVLRGSLTVRTTSGEIPYAAPACLLLPPRWQHFLVYPDDVAPDAEWLVLGTERETLTFVHSWSFPLEG